MRLRRPAVIFLVAFGLRLGVSGILLSGTIHPWGVNEAAAIAQQLIRGNGFASPFHEASGPTAWLAPVYPCLVAGLFLVFGVKTMAAAWAAVFLNVLFGSLTALCVLRLGSQQFGESTGLLAAWAWAVSPPAVVMPWYLWETCLSALILTLGLLMFLRLDGSSRLYDWVACGCVWGGAALLNPAILAPLPALLIFKAWKAGRWRSAAVLLLACTTCVVPWTLRNSLVFHRAVPIRTNFWPEVYFGNISFDLHPTGDSMVYQKEGEIGFSADLKKRVVQAAYRAPKLFLHRIIQRLFSFWIVPAQFRPLPVILALGSLAGIVCAGAAGRDWFSFASVLAFYPVTYYLSYVFARSRHPIEPVMYILSALTVTATLRLRRRSLNPGALSPSRR